MAGAEQTKLKAPFVQGGEGCGCEDCCKPLPQPDVQTEGEARRRQAVYRVKRGLPAVQPEHSPRQKLGYRPT